MSVEMTTFELPGGTTCLRIVTGGHFSKEDAEAVVQRTSPGGPYFGMPQLVLTQQQVSGSSDARGVLAAARGGHGESEPWVAVVITNRIGRVGANFLMRVLGNKRMRLFGAEAEAVRWMVERIQEGQAAKGE